MASLNSTVLYFVFLQAIFITSIIASSNSHEYDRITKLPGQPKSPAISQFSGYITVNEDHGRALFYWFFESQTESTRKPLLLWLNGGPGCSSIGYGAAIEIGPLRVGKDGVGLEYNEHSWYKEANLLFVESPVGVGFSYTNTSSDLHKLNDEFVAEDAYNFLLNWLARFPQFKNRDFFISGESYAGHYVPQLAELVYDRNKLNNKYPYINLKGFIVGNPETNDPYDLRGLVEYAWSHAIIPDQEYFKGKQDCDLINNVTSGCDKIVSLVFNKYKEIDIYNVYAPKCLINSSLPAYDDTNEFDSHDESLSYSLMRRMRLVPGGYDPCYSLYTEDYFNREDVVAAIHANLQHSNGTWRTCSKSLLSTYEFTNPSILPIYKKLIKGGQRIWIYSGDADGRVPFIGTRYCVESLKLPLKSPWRSWFHNNQVGGSIVEYKGLTLGTVRGAGHLVPLNKPSEALALIHSYLTGEPLPNQR